MQDSNTDDITRVVEETGAIVCLKRKKLYLQLKLYIALLTMYLKQQGETVNFFSIQYYVYTNVKIFIEALTNKTKEVTPTQRKFWFLFPHIVSLLFVSYSKIYNNKK